MYLFHGLLECIFHLNIIHMVRLLEEKLLKYKIDKYVYPWVVRLFYSTDRIVCKISKFIEMQSSGI